MGMKDSTGFQIDDHSHIVAPLADSELINSEAAHFVQLPSGKTRGKMSLEDLFDQIPADGKQESHVFNRGDLTQVNHELIEGFESSTFSFGEVNGLLQIATTTATLLKMTMKNHKLLSPSYRQSTEYPCEGAVHDQMSSAGTTMGATSCIFLLVDMVIDGTRRNSVLS